MLQLQLERSPWLPVWIRVTGPGRVVGEGWEEQGELVVGDEVASVMACDCSGHFWVGWGRDPTASLLRLIVAAEVAEQPRSEQPCWV